MENVHYSIVIGIAVAIWASVILGSSAFSTTIWVFLRSHKLAFNSLAFAALGAALLITPTVTEAVIKTKDMEIRLKRAKAKISSLETKISELKDAKKLAMIGNYNVEVTKGYFPAEILSARVLAAAASLENAGYKVIRDKADGINWELLAIDIKKKGEVKNKSDAISILKGNGATITKTLN